MAQYWDRLWFVVNAVMGVLVMHTVKLQSSGTTDSFSKSTLLHVSLQLNVRNWVLMCHMWAH